MMQDTMNGYLAAKLTIALLDTPFLAMEDVKKLISPNDLDSSTGFFRLPPLIWKRTVIMWDAWICVQVLHQQHTIFDALSSAMLPQRYTLFAWMASLLCGSFHVSVCPFVTSLYGPKQGIGLTSQVHHFGHGLQHPLGKATAEKSILWPYFATDAECWMAKL